MEQSVILFNETILLLSGVLWVLVTWTYRGRIKSYGVYSLFGFAIYSLVLLVVLYRFDSVSPTGLIVVGAYYALVLASYIYRLVSRGIGFEDTLIFPLAILMLVLIVMVAVL